MASYSGLTTDQLIKEINRAFSSMFYAQTDDIKGLWQVRYESLMQEQEDRMGDEQEDDSWLTKYEDDLFGEEDAPAGYDEYDMAYDR